MIMPQQKPPTKMFMARTFITYRSFREFKRGSDVGLDIDELKTISTDELKNIRQSIYEYLVSTKLKKGNANFKEAFLRITKELEDRKKAPPIPLEEKENKAKTKQGKKREFLKKKRQHPIKEIIEEKKEPIKLDIPRFLNDEPHSSENPEEIKDNEQEDYNKKVYKSFFTFSSGLDLELKEDDDDSEFKIKKTDPIEMALKIFDIKQKIYGQPIQEEPMFSLESDKEF